jgi:hypothetical protein
MTMDENENKPVFDEKAGLEKNLTVPILVVAMLTALAVWFVPDDEEEIDLKKPLPQLDSVIKPLDTGGSELPPLDTGSTIRPLEEIEADTDDGSTKASDTAVARKPAEPQGDRWARRLQARQRPGADRCRHRPTR